MAASCMATFRPIAPTPITVAWTEARRSCGTRSCCRVKRSFSCVLNIAWPFRWLWSKAGSFVREEIIPKVEHLAPFVQEPQLRAFKLKARIIEPSWRPLVDLDIGKVLIGPGSVIAGREGPTIIDLDRQHEGAAGADMKLQPRRLGLGRQKRE